MRKKENKEVKQNEKKDVPNVIFTTNLYTLPRDLQRRLCFYLLGFDLISLQYVNTDFNQIIVESKISEGIWRSQLSYLSNLGRLSRDYNFEKIPAHGISTTLFYRSIVKKHSRFFLLVERQHCDSSMDLESTERLKQKMGTYQQTSYGKWLIAQREYLLTNPLRDLQIRTSTKEGDLLIRKWVTIYMQETQYRAKEFFADKLWELWASFGEKHDQNDLHVEHFYPVVRLFLSMKESPNRKKIVLKAIDFLSFAKMLKEASFFTCDFHKLPIAGFVNLMKKILAYYQETNSAFPEKVIALLERIYKFYPEQFKVNLLVKEFPNLFARNYDLFYGNGKLQKIIYFNLKASETAGKFSNPAFLEKIAPSQIHMSL